MSDKSKQSIIFYTAWLDMMCSIPAEDAQEILKAIRAYRDGSESEFSNPIVEAYFNSTIRTAINANDDKYQAKVERVKEARKRRSDIRMKSECNQNDFNMISECNQNDFNSVSVSDSVSVSESVSVSPVEISNSAQAREATQEPLPDLTGMLPEKVADAMNAWIAIRRAKGPFPYGAVTEALSSARTNVEKYGEEACLKVIRIAREGAYSAVPWDRLEKNARSGTTSSARQNSFTAIQNNEYDFDALERHLRGGG